MNSLFKPLGQPRDSKTVPMALAVLRMLESDARLVFPGHVLNAQQFRLILANGVVALPSRVPQWLYDQGFINAAGHVTDEGYSKIRSLAATAALDANRLSPPKR
jgi:hypothetical protein